MEWSGLRKSGKQWQVRWGRKAVEKGQSGLCAGTVAPRRKWACEQLVSLIEKDKKGNKQE